MPLTLLPPTADDLQALLDFELTNRAFFEARINARPPSYYSADGVAAAIASAIDDAANDRGYQFLVRADSGELVGRANLAGVRRPHYHSASLGYRIAEQAAGKGYASQAVRRIVEIAFGALGLHRIEADVRDGNVASLRVLSRNGFIQYGHSRRSFELAGVWHDRLHFERHSEKIAEE